MQIRTGVSFPWGCFPSHQRNPKAGIGVASSDSLHGDPGSADKTIEVFQLQTGSEGVGPVDSRSHCCGLAVPGGLPAMELIEKTRGGEIVASSRFRRRVSLQLLPRGAGACAIRSSAGTRDLRGMVQHFGG